LKHRETKFGRRMPTSSGIKGFIHNASRRKNLP
jgi:hypothetical protein